MMISPEEYYKEHLKGKNVEQITSTIRSLKQQIGRLKTVLEHPYYACNKCPGEDVQLAMAAKYLEQAKQALAEAGSTYVPSQAERRIDSFNANLNHANEIIFEQGQSMGNSKIISVKITGNDLILNVRSRFSFDNTAEYTLKEHKNDFFLELQKIGLGQWHRTYDTYRYGIAIMDGDFWELTISFSNGKRKVRFSGNNAYPFNFQQLQELFDNLLVNAEK